MRANGSPLDGASVLSVAIGVVVTLYGAYQHEAWIAAMVGIATGMNIGALILRWDRWRSDVQRAEWRRQNGHS